MQELNVPAPGDPAKSDAQIVPWTMGDVGRGIATVVAGIILVSIVAAIVGLAIAGGADDIEEDPAALTAVLILSIPLELVFAVAAIAFSVRKYNLSFSSLGFRSPDKSGVLLAIGLLIGGLAIIWVYFGALALAGVEPDADLPDEVFDNPGPIIAVAILSLGFAPLIEELFFRGFVFGGLRGRWGLLWAALASGFLFGIAHLGNPGSFYVVPPISLVGALFAWGYAFSGSLYPSIAAHFMFNAFSLTVGLANA